MKINPKNYLKTLIMRKLFQKCDFSISHHIMSNCFCFLYDEYFNKIESKTND